MRLYLFSFFIVMQAAICQADSFEGLKIYNLKIPLEDITQNQNQVGFLMDYCRRIPMINDLKKCWESLDVSRQATYFSITHALCNVDGCGDALGLVQDVQEIHGQEDHESSSLQFNIEVNWRPEAYETLRRCVINPRPGSGHPGETGLGEGRHGHTGLHFLFDKKNLLGHVHVDYRPATWLGVLGNKVLRKDSSHGHFNWYNADPRAVGPEKDEEHRAYNNLELHEDWYGPFNMGALSASLPPFLQTQSSSIFVNSQ